MERSRRSRTHMVRNSLTDVMQVRRHRPDYLLVILALVLMAIGLVVIYSIGPALAALNHGDDNYFAKKQLLAIALAAAAFVVASRVPMVVWRRLAKPLMVLAFIATLVALIMPVNPAYPAHRWVRLGGLSFQSVELLKFALVTWMAGILVGRRGLKGRDLSKIFKLLVVVLLLVGLVVAGLQKDLGSAAVIVVMLLTMAYAAGVPLKKMGIFIVIVAIVGTIAVTTVPYRRDRVTAFLNPTANCQTSTGWQACQAMIAVGSGGMIGLGLGRSVQAYGYLPEASNDSIFAIYAEKFGLIGCIILLAVFAGLFYRVKRVAERAPDEYSRLAVLGVLMWFSVEAMINIGGMIGIIPMKGITLPFVSYGGTSMIFSGAAIGLVFQVSKYASLASPRIRNTERRLEHGNNNVSRRRFGRSYHTASSSRSRT